jgi:hypothetical protein
MAARKKTAKAKAKRKKVRAGKPATRVKRAAAKTKKVAKKKIARRPARAAPKAAAPVARGKAPAAARQPVRPPAPKAPPAQPVSAGQAAAPRAKPASAPERAAKPPAAAPAPAAKPAPAEERIGVVSHYFAHISVAALLMESGTLRVGDTIHVKGHTTDFTQRVDSLQVDHAPVSEVHSGQDFGVKVREHAREHDVVYKVAAS